MRANNQVNWSHQRAHWCLSKCHSYNTVSRINLKSNPQKVSNEIQVGDKVEILEKSYHDLCAGTTAIVVKDMGDQVIVIFDYPVIDGNFKWTRMSCYKTSLRRLRR